MKIIFTAIVLLVLCMTVSAQSVVVSGVTGKFQSVGGDFGKTWITNLQAQNPKQSAQESKDTLWGWGTVPKGKALAGGQLVDAPNNTWLYNTSGNWLGDNYVDPYTGQPVYTKYTAFPSNSAQQGFLLPEILRSTTSNALLDPWAI